MSQPLKHALIVCHPAQNSFTHSVAERYAQAVTARGQEVVLRDLYREGFDPVLRAAERAGRPGDDIVAEWATLGAPDVYVFVYPIWFGAPPAILIGYIDRVFGAGWQEGGGAVQRTDHPLVGKYLLSLSSSGSTKVWLDEKGILRSLRTVYDRYLADVFGFAETSNYHFDGVTPDIPEREVRQHLLEVDQIAHQVMARFHFVRP